MSPNDVVQNVVTLQDLRALDGARTRKLRQRYARSAAALVWLWLGWSGGAVFFGTPIAELLWVVAFNLCATALTFGLLARSIRAVEDPPATLPLMLALDAAHDRIRGLIAIWSHAAWALGLAIAALVFFDADPLHRAFGWRVLVATYAVPLLILCIRQARGFLAHEASGLRHVIAATRRLAVESETPMLPAQPE